MKIAVIDDDIEFAKFLKDKLSHIITNRRIDIYKDIEEKIYYTKYDFIFLDVMLEDEVSFEYGVKIKKYNPDVQIVYMSNFEHMIFDSIQFDVFFFIRKENLDHDIHNLLKKLEEFKRRKELSVEIIVNSLPLTIPQRSIMYIESIINTNMISIFSTDKTYETYLSLTKMYKMVNQNNFVKLNAQYIINLYYVDHVNKDSLILTNSKEIYFTRGSKQKFLEAYMKYKGRKLWNS